MTEEHGDRPRDDGNSNASAPRRAVSRRGAVAGVIGLAAVLGGGAYLLTDRITDHHASTTTAARDVPVVPAVSSAAASDSTTSPPASSPTSSASPSPKAAKSHAQSRTPQQEVAAARKAMAEHGVKVMHPVTPQSDSAGMALAESATETDTGSLKKDRATMRVVTAHGDLTGLRELAWVAGGITKHGDVSCSQTFRFANEAKPAKKPNLLVCWKTSPAKSVITAAVQIDGHPSASKSQAVIAREWRKLG